jgi:predicted nucleic acid-binding protein
MGQYLIDNNVISSYFSALFPDKEMEFISGVIDQIPNISIITQIEALSWVNSDTSKEEVIQEFIHDSNVLWLTPAIVSRCVKIRRNKKIKTPDAIIAATAIEHNLTLITSDKDFDNVMGLTILHPKNL